MTDTPNETVQEAPKKKFREAARTSKTRKHLITTIYKNDVADKLDKLHADGHTVLSVTSSSDIRGFEIISYREE